MTTPTERMRALQHTRQFLEELCDPEQTPGVPDAVRLRAQRYLRHYPQDAVLDILDGALPQWFRWRDTPETPREAGIAIGLYKFSDAEVMRRIRKRGGTR